MMDVVGDDSILGELMGEDVMGYGRHGHGGHSVHTRGGHRYLRIGKKPGWRAQLAPGVIQPDEGLLPLPLAGNGGTNTFTATQTVITFQGSLQKPFRGERPLVSTVRTGASATGRLITQMFVGTDLMLADINGIDIELLGQANAFGTRLTMKAAEPGVLIRFLTTITPAPTGTDTIAVQMMLLGRVVH